MVLSDFSDVGADEGGRLLVNVALASIAVVLLEMGEGLRRRNRIDVGVTVVVKGNVDKRIVRQTKDDVAHVVGFRTRQFFENPFDSPLVFVSVIAGLGRVTRYQSFFHVDSPFVNFTVEKQRKGQASPVDRELFVRRRRAGRLHFH